MTVLQTQQLPAKKAQYTALFPKSLANECNCNIILLNYDNLDMIHKKTTNLSKALI